MLPLWVALAALVGAAGILLLLGTTTRGIRNEIAEFVEPARSHLYDIQRILALEDAAQRGYLLTRADHFIVEYHAYRAEEDTAFMSLRQLVVRIGPEAVARYDSLVEHTERWRATAFDPELLAAPPRSLAADRELEEQEAVFAGALRAADRLEAAIQEAAEVRRARILSLERMEIRVVIVLVLVALGAVLVLVRTTRHMRALVTRSQRLARAAETKQHELERVAEEKEKFIRGVTHDLKNPLGAVDGFAQFLESGMRGELTEGQLEWVRRIRKATREALSTIQELMELARTQTVSLKVERRSTDVWQIVQETAEDYQAALEASGHVLRTESPDHLPDIPTDGGRVREILANLLSNANKYTPPGTTITIGAALRRPGPSLPGEWVAVWVHDTGPGIPEEERERIFEEFHRVPGTPALGTGVGLSISRRVARLLGGDLTLAESPEEGTCFVLWLPVPTFKPPREK